MSLTVRGGGAGCAAGMEAVAVCATVADHGAMVMAMASGTPYKPYKKETRARIVAPCLAEPPPV
jgi:hypothetical protein